METDGAKGEKKKHDVNRIKVNFSQDLMNSLVNRINGMWTLPPIPGQFMPLDMQQENVSSLSLQTQKKCRQFE